MLSIKLLAAPLLVERLFRLEAVVQFCARGMASAKEPEAFQSDTDELELRCIVVYCLPMASTMRVLLSEES
jgi:hypothetical protein